MGKALEFVKLLPSLVKAGTRIAKAVREGNQKQVDYEFSYSDAAVRARERARKRWERQKQK